MPDNFGIVLDDLHNGGCWRREVWGTDIFIFLSHATIDGVGPHIDLSANGSMMPYWSADSRDLLADDWKRVESAASFAGFGDAG